MRAIVLAALVTCGSLAAEAHHSAVLFDLTKTVTLMGTMTEVDWRNPHVFISLDVRSETGRPDAWKLETGAPSWFRTRTFGKKEFESGIGRPVTVQVVRAKDGSLYGYLYRITFDDGRSADLR